MLVDRPTIRPTRFHMANPRNDVSAQEVRAEFAYDRATGVITRRRNGARVGTPNTAGYLQVSFRNKRYYAHRLAWLIETGEWPAHEIDHINSNRADNRWVNLRDLSHKANVLRQRGVAP